MKSQTSAGSTFRVHDVDVVRTPLSTWKTRDSIVSILANVTQDTSPEPVLTCSGYNSNVVKDLQHAAYHSLFFAVHLAYAEHRPLVLSPDAIWLTILQGLAQHVRLNVEKLRSTLVSHQDKKTLVVAVDIDPDSPESDWWLVIEALTKALEEDAVEWAAKLVSDFSTTGPIERLASQVSLLDVFESYYDYVVLAGCGFPEITLRGESSDWLNLRQKIELLEPFQVDFWLPHLREIADKMYDASRGKIDLEFWKNMYKRESLYGADVCNGWLLKLIPYLRDDASQQFTELNPIFDDSEEMKRYFRGARSKDLPAGMSVVPFRCVDARTRTQRTMELIGGFTGVEQDPDTFALEPKIGWGVRNEGSSNWSWLKDRDCEMECRCKYSTFDEEIHRLQSSLKYIINIPRSFFSFYKTCGGLTFKAEDGISWEVLPMEKLKVIVAFESGLEFYPREKAPASDLQPDPETYDSNCIDVISDPMIRFAEADDGSCAALLYTVRGVETVYVYDKNGKLLREVSKLQEFLKELIPKI